MPTFDPASIGATKFDPTSIGATKSQPSGMSDFPEEKQEEPKRGVFEKVADFFFKSTSDTVSAIKEGIDHRQRVTSANDQITALQERNREVINQAKRENDPYRKAQLLDESRSISSQVAQVADGVEHGEAKFLKSADITERDIERGNEEFALRRGAGVALEAGATLLSGTAGAKALMGPAGGLARLGRGAVVGAGTGALGSGSRAAVEAETPEEAAEKILAGTATGAAIGGLFNLVLGKRPQTAAKKIQEQQKTIYNDLAEDEVISSRRTKDLFKSQFNVPEKVATRTGFDKQSEELVKHNIGGTMDDMVSTSEYVTGRDGILSNIHKDMIKNSDFQVNSNAAIDAMNEAIEKSPEVDKEKANKIARYVLRRMKPGGKIGTIDSQDAYNLVKELEEVGYQKIQESTALTPRVASVQEGNIYLAAAQSLKDQMDEVVFNEGLLNKYKTPEVINALKVVSPRLAKQFKNAQTSSDLRRIQAPFVTLAQMAKITINKANTPFSNLGRQAQIPSLTKLPVVAAQKALSSPAGTQALVGASSLTDRLTRQAGDSGVLSLMRALSNIAGQQAPRVGAENIEY